MRRGGASAAQVTGMPSRKALPRAVPAALVVAAWLSFAPAAMATVPQASVLILLPGQPGLPAATAIASGVRAELLAALSFGVSIEMEHVDIARFASVTGKNVHSARSTPRSTAVIDSM